MDYGRVSLRKSERAGTPSKGIHKKGCIKVMRGVCTDYTYRAERRDGTSMEANSVTTATM